MLTVGLLLSGCAGQAKLTGDQQLELIRRLGEYGCGGSLSIDAGAAAGQIGGEAHASFAFDGRCPERPVIPPGPGE